MNLPWCGDCRAMLAILTTSLTLALPMLVRGAAEENPPAVTSNDIPPTRAEDVRGKSADERVAELEARVEKLEQELRQLRAAAQSAAAALASTSGGRDAPTMERSGNGSTIADPGNVGGGSNTASANPAPDTMTQQSIARDRNSFASLSEESKKEFFVEMRAMVESMPNSSPEERSNAVREIVNRLRAKDDARKIGSDVSSKGNPDNSSNNPTDALPKMLPEGTRSQDPAQAPPTTVERTGSPDDATRRRFEALNAEQRNRFIQEMRNMREKMQYATPDERGAMVQELLTKVEKEPVETSATPEAPVPAPPPAAPPKAPEKTKVK